MKIQRYLPKVEFIISVLLVIPMQKKGFRLELGVEPMLRALQVTKLGKVSKVKELEEAIVKKDLAIKV